MKYLNDSIIPFVGLDSFRFGDSLEKVRIKLKEDKIPFNQGMGLKDDQEEVSIKIYDCINLFFINGILFEIALEEGFQGKLINGIFIGMSMDDANSTDCLLKYNDDDEGFISPDGYMIVDDIDTNKVCEIEIFIKEVLNDEEFYSYEWLKKYH